MGTTEFKGNEIQVSTLVEPIDYNTNHPVVGNGTESNAKGAFLSAQIPEMTLSIGDSLSFSGSVVLNGGVIGKDEYRVGIWNDNGQFEARNPKNWLDGWVYVIDLGLWRAVTNGRVFLSLAQTGAALFYVK